MIVYKSAGAYIITLELLQDSKTNLNRSNIKFFNYASFRTDKAKVISICHKLTNNAIQEINSDNDPLFIYKINKIIHAKDYDENILNTCTTGIHFYVVKEAAYYHEIYNYVQNYTGLSKRWFHNGNKYIVCSYENGSRNGLYAEWYENDQIYVICTYKKGIQYGSYEEWDKYGNKTNNIIQYKSI